MDIIRFVDIPQKGQDSKRDRVTNKLHAFELKKKTNRKQNKGDKFERTPHIDVFGGIAGYPGGEQGQQMNPTTNY